MAVSGQGASARRIWTALEHQVSRLRWLLLAAYGVTAVGLLGLVVVNVVADVPLRLFFTDPVTEFSAPMYVGLISNFGIVLWGSAASVCLFAAWLLRADAGHGQHAEFLAAAGLLSSVLLFDDLYLLHEEVIPERLHIPQPLVLAAYVVLVAWFMARYRRLIEGSDFVLLLLAGFFFAVSVLIDIVFPEGEILIVGDLPGRDLVEDGPKLLGIVTWTIYMWRTATQLARTPAGAGE